RVDDRRRDTAPLQAAAVAGDRSVHLRGLSRSRDDPQRDRQRPLAPPLPALRHPLGRGGSGETSLARGATDWASRHSRQAGRPVDGHPARAEAGVTEGLAMRGNQSEASTRVEGLDLLRLVAALSVVIYHYSFRGAA